jgi:alkylation response protein AidB-like acyl-CoA dehydrogenase
VFVTDQLPHRVDGSQSWRGGPKAAQEVQLQLSIMATAQTADAAAVPWRQELREWLEAHAPRDLRGPDELGTSEPHRAWERTLYEAGYAAIHWPQEFGGWGADALARMIFQEEYERAGAPDRINIQALMLAGPVLMQFGTQEQRDRWLMPMLRCEEVWCQGFSEPGAGSDLGALRTHGRVDGEELVINGQKIWTSYASYSDWIFLLVRTDPQAAKHAGITWVMVDMATAGLEVRPLRQMNGSSDFAEVFFTDVRVPLWNVVGGLGDGWRIAMAALNLERGPGRRSYVRYLRNLNTLKSFVDSSGMTRDPSVQEDVGDLFASVMAYRHYMSRVVDDLRSTGDSDVARINKLYWSELQAKLFETGMGVLDERAGFLDDGDSIPGAAAWRNEYWYSRASLIFGGTNQIQKNIIAERLLGLPRGGS